MQIYAGRIFIIALLMLTLVCTVGGQASAEVFLDELGNVDAFTGRPRLGFDAAASQREFEDILNVLDQHAEETKTFGPQFLWAEYQFDTRGFNTVNFMGATPLPYEFWMWGFIDLEGLDAPGGNRADTAHYFFELDISRKVIGDTGVIAEWNDKEGDGNAIGRAGFFYTPSHEFFKERKFFLTFKTFLYNSVDGWQGSFAWNKEYADWLDGRVSTGGFFDVNLMHGRTVIVSDTQVRYRLVDGFHVLVEFRYNGFRPTGKDFGTGIGAQYRF